MFDGSKYVENIVSFRFQWVDFQAKSDERDFQVKKTENLSSKNANQMNKRFE